MPVTSQDHSPTTGQGNSKERICLTVGSVFTWGSGITLKILICYLNMIQNALILTKDNIRISPFSDFEQLAMYA